MSSLVAAQRRGISLDLSEAIVGACLLCGLTFIAQWKYGFGWSDEGLLWYASQRTALGEVPLRDFFSYDPGRYYWTSAIFRLTGHDGLFTLLASCAAFGAVGLAAIWFVLCRARMRGGLRIACAVLIALALGYPRHKVFEQTASLVLVAMLFFVLLRPRAAMRWSALGIATGLAAILGRNHGVFYVIAAVFCMGFSAFSEKRLPGIKIIAAYAGGVVLGYLPLLLAILAVPGFRDAFMTSVLFTKDWQLALPIPFPWRLELRHLPLVDALQAESIGIACLVFPAIYCFGIASAAWAERKQQERDPSMVLLLASSLAGIPYLQQAFDRADFGHIAQATLPVFPAAFAAANFYWSNARLRSVVSGAVVAFAVLCVIAWLPSEPAVAYRRMMAEAPDAVEWVPISGKQFAVPKYEADVLRAVRKTVQSCNIKSDEFMTAPHFAGIYAYLNAKAPFWELYYLYPRSPEFQRRHIAAMSRTRLILLAPDATVDGLERLKLQNTYGLLMRDIAQRFTELQIPGLPQGMKMVGLNGALHCQ
ncbi:hypothetical protein [Caballeronia sp. BCC1704]|uniref:hypothetical protein n=1 Tax=Caballeronia sp. BCC1704 TaxID=2676300 RepID=UPI0015890FFE|nr:hypothetical protein [Caballeronia sp. BCC1704]